MQNNYILLRDRFHFLYGRTLRVIFSAVQHNMFGDKVNICSCIPEGGT